MLVLAHNPIGSSFGETLIKSLNPQGKPINKSWILDLLDWDCESVAYYTVCCLSSAFWARMF
jgi:hypothetical protein